MTVITDTVHSNVKKEDHGTDHDAASNICVRQCVRMDSYRASARIGVSGSACTHMHLMRNEDPWSTTQVDSAFYPPWDGNMSTSQRAVMFCGWGVKAGMV